jgi:tRNA pseudouridine(55) synthase
MDPNCFVQVPIALGNATRLLPYMSDSSKEYDAIIKFGIRTEEQDTTGAFVVQTPVDIRQAFGSPELLLHKVKQVANAKFLGEISQVPPVHSAVRVGGGRRSYEIARSETTTPVPLKSRQVHVYDWKFHDVCKCGGADDNGGLHPTCLYPEVQCSVFCGSGVYVRTLAQDIGEAIGLPSTLAQLRRTRAGYFEGSRSTLLKDVRRSKLHTMLVHADEPFACLPAVLLMEQENYDGRDLRDVWRTAASCPSFASACGSTTRSRNEVLFQWTSSRRRPAIGRVIQGGTALKVPIAHTNPRLKGLTRVYMIGPSEFMNPLPLTANLSIDNTLCAQCRPIFLGLGSLADDGAATDGVVQVKKEVTLIDGDFDIRTRSPLYQPNPMPDTASTA